MLEEAWKAHDKDIAKTYRLLRNLLSGDVQSQWDPVCCKMHERELWAGVNGQMTTGRHLCLWSAFWECLKLHNLTYFTADAAKRHRFYIQQAVCKPQRATVQQHVSQIGVLHDYIRYLPMLNDSAKAVPTMNKGIIPFGEAVKPQSCSWLSQWSGRASTTWPISWFLSWRVHCYWT